MERGLQHGTKIAAIGLNNEVGSAPAGMAAGGTCTSSAAGFHFSSSFKWMLICWRRRSVGTRSMSAPAECLSLFGLPPGPCEWLSESSQEEVLSLRHVWRVASLINNTQKKQKQKKRRGRATAALCRPSGLHD